VLYELLWNGLPVHGLLDFDCALLRSMIRAERSSRQPKYRLAQYNPAIVKISDWRIRTCSPPSTLLASLTLPMLPAPIVFPKTQLPVWAGIVVRDLAGFPECLLSIGVTTGAGPPPFVTAVVPDISEAV
jgi:hypothetical protein